jgi:phosphoglycolate phosphatase-like HAD superfamily hydrolase
MVGPVRVLVLWDVDGTLISNGGVGKRVHAKAFALMTGRPPTERVITDGMTDLAILQSMFARHGLPFTPSDTASAESAMTEALASLAHELPLRGNALPGSRSAIDALSQTPGVLQSVLTGNVARNAFVKLAAFGLAAGLDFEIGGYGADSSVRADLVAVAQAKAFAKYGFSFGAQSTVLIGDTPRDIEAGQRGGARVIAVASGLFTVDDLSSLRPDVVLPSLTNTDLLVQSVLASS